MTGLELTSNATAHVKCQNLKHNRYEFIWRYRPVIVCTIRMNANWIRSRAFLFLLPPRTSVVPAHVEHDFDRFCWCNIRWSTSTVRLTYCPQPPAVPWRARKTFSKSSSPAWAVNSPCRNTLKSYGRIWTTKWTWWPITIADGTKVSALGNFGRRMVKKIYSPVVFWVWDALCCFQAKAA